MFEWDTQTVMRAPVAERESAQVAASLVPGVSVANGALLWSSPEAPWFNAVDAVGTPIVDAATQMLGRRYVPKMLAPKDWPICSRLPGTWLYAGPYYTHFGHFLVESLARLWVLDHIGEKIDGILYAWSRNKPLPQHARQGFQQDLLARCGCGDVPVEIINHPVQVERLIVPRQGFGLGELSAGTPEFRAFIRDRLRRGSNPGAHRKLYISRQGFGLRRGGLFDEDRLVRKLAEQGYAEIRPERIGLQAQIDAYLGADRIISTDNSALHLVGFLAKEHQRVAMVLRRKVGGVDLVPNLAACMGRMPLVVDQITHFHRNRNQPHINWSCYAELDLPAVWHELAEQGFVSGTPWPAMRHRRRQRLLAAYASRLGAVFDTERL
ncbi:glycosyltransferase 61 family protein [Phaeobacter sp.]|uniref:glycosyltransferase family 61 protein n=1 Tax=Phaeobacter sp. TaxID=1902409 RepID=UPI0025DAF8B3|nr:glycosyltransferase 61 family protein [Phaeobacter sp.]